MSLNAAERRRTADELRENLRRSGRSEADVAADLRWELERLSQTLAVEGADPVDVWRLRDHLEAAVLAAGGTPVPFTVLSADMRDAASGWFGLER